MKNIYRIKGEVVARNVGGETILVPVLGTLAEMQKIFALNPVGAFIWSRLDGKVGLADLKNYVVDEFDVSAEQAEEDIIAFINGLLEAGLIEAVS
jgi:hypothetical protein